jgi:hypothetical protein
VTGGWRKLSKEELRDLYSSPSIDNIIKLERMRWTGHVVRVGVKRNAYGILVGKPDGKRPLRSPRSRWVGNIKVDPVEIEIWLSDVDWIGLAQDENKCNAFVNAEISLRVP